MLIDGEKWACEACVRGHRVSNCQHYDRPLQHINKKGRPVTQCQHCRSQRKNRSAHVKCDCGEKTNKCIHLGALEGHRESCCCNHGGRCTCSFKNDLDTVPETAGLAAESGLADEGLLSTSASAAVSGSASAAAPGSANGSASGKSPVRRRRANTTRSEGTLTFDEHGRHKPLSQKHAKAASQKTSPYPIARLSSARSTGGLSGFLLAANNKSAARDEDDADDVRSTSHTASDSGAEDPSASVLTQALVGAAATSAAAAALGTCGPYLPPQVTTTATTAAQQRRSRSETASPLLFANSFPQAHQLSGLGGNPLSPLNMGLMGYGGSGNGGGSNSNSYTNYNAFSPDQAEQPLFSAGLSAPSVDWSQFGLDIDRGFSTSSNDEKFGSAETYGFTRNFGYDFNGSEQAPTMTTGTSGEVSEAEDPIVPGLDDYEYDYEYDGATDAASGSIAFSRTNSSFHLATSALNVRNAAATSAATMAPAALAATATASNDVNELRFLKAGNKFLPTPVAGSADDVSGLLATRHHEEGVWINEYSGLPSMTESPESDVISFWAK